MSATEKGATVEVIVSKAGHFLGAREFVQGQITIGRADNAMVRLVQETISSRHATVTFTGKSCVLEDAASRHGLFVNGERVTRRLVTDNDTVVIGDYSLQFVVHHPQAVGKANGHDLFGEPDHTAVDVLGLAGGQPPPARPSPALPTPAPPRARARTATPPISAVAVASGQITTSARGSAVAAAYAQEPEAVQQHAPVAEEEEEEDDANFVEPFSMVQRMQEAMGATVPPGVSAWVAVVRARNHRVQDIRYISPGFQFPWSRPLHGAIKIKPAAVSLNLDKVAGVQAMHGNEPLSDAQLQPLIAGRTLTVPQGVTLHLTLPQGDTAVVGFVARQDASLGSATPPQIALTELGALTGKSFAVHGLIVALMVAFGVGRMPAPPEDLDGRFAKIAIEEPVPEPVPEPPAPPPPPPEPEPVVEKAPQPQPRAPQPKVRQPKAPPVKVAQAPAPPQPSAAAKSLLSALGAVPTKANAVAMTNLDAVQAAGARGGFKVSGTIGKLPGGELRLSGATGVTGRVDTKSASELGSLGKVQGKTSGDVRGRVSQAPARSVEVEGHLDRGLIQKVVNEHLHQVQACYERALFDSPNLGGRIAFEWVIGTSGDVTTVRVKQSSVKSAKVASCIQSAIKGWQFPKPNGGQVTVTYPFIFSSGAG